MRNQLLTLLAIAFAGAAPVLGQTPPGPEKSPPAAGTQMIESPSLESAAEAEEPAAVEVVPRPQRFWLRAEYLLWGIKDSNLPALLTTTSFPTTDPRPGSLDSPNTHILFGGSSLSNRDRNGGRFFAGWWLGDSTDWGVEAGYFFLGTRSAGFLRGSQGNPILARPFFNANAGIQDSSVDAFPGAAGGTVKIDVPSFLQGVEGNLVNVLFQRQNFRLEGLAGFRYLSLRESLQVSENDFIDPSVPVFFAGDQVQITDRFETQNNFYGGQLGLRGELRRRRFFVNGFVKVGLGDSNQVVDIHGATAINRLPFAPAGLLAVASNSGHFTHDAFAVVPEIGANLGFRFTENLRGFVGYSFLYWTQVARPADQVDTAVNLNQVPTSGTFGMTGGPARPAFIFHSTDFYAHGVNFGLELRF
jgi:hypothetical protein